VKCSSAEREAVYGLLRNRVYLGELSYGLDRRFVNTNAHEPIVDLATWQAAQNPKGRQLARPRSERRGYLLSGILRCAGCGYSLQGTTTSRGKTIYRCTRRHAGGLCPAPAWFDADTLEQAAEAAFWQLTSDLEAEGQPADDPAELHELEAALERAERNLAQWTSPEVQDAIGDMAEYATGLRERRQQREQAAEELGRLRVAPSPTPLSTETLRGAWERMTLAERRELIGLRFDCLALSRERSLVAYPSGTAPDGLPRRGYSRDARLAPFPDTPADARVLTL
jgi:hypothetical protein